MHGGMKSDLDRARSPLARRPADKFLECPAECGFGFVADIMGDSGNLDTGIRKPLPHALRWPIALPKSWAVRRSST